MNELITRRGTFLGMGLSNISSVHLFENGLSRDRNYFLRMSGQQLLIFRGSVKRPHRETIHENSLANLRNKKKVEGISSQVKRKIMKYIDNWFTAIDYAKASGSEDKINKKKHLALLTLTLPFKQMHDDKYLKRYALMMFIKTMINHYPSINYLWKAEAQVNGNIHFHIIIDEYIPFSETDKWWYSRMELLGYNTKYYEKEGKRSSSACNVESLRDKNSAGAYVAKYFSKHKDGRNIEGRLWGCSDRIKNLSSAEIQVNTEELDECLNLVNFNIADAYIRDYCAVFKHVQGIEKLTLYALNNYKYQTTLTKNVYTLYSHQYEMFREGAETDWEQDIINEIGHINALYLFENELLGF